MSFMTSSVSGEVEWDGLHDELDSLFVGPLKHLQGVFVDGSRLAKPTFSLDEFLCDNHVDAMAEAFCRAHGETPRVAICSIWSKWYFATVLPTLICAGILLDRLPPFRLSEIRLALDADYKIECVAISRETSFALMPGHEPRFRSLIDGNIRPFIELFHARTGVSRRVLWSNAGNLFEGVVRHLEKLEFTAPGVGEGLTLMSTRAFADGMRNRLYSPVTYPTVGGARVRRRRVCCLRNQLPDRALCCACPLHETGRSREFSSAEPAERR